MGTLPTRSAPTAWQSMLHGTSKLCFASIWRGEDGRWESSDCRKNPTFEAWRSVMHAASPKELCRARSTCWKGSQDVQPDKVTRVQLQIDGAKSAKLERQADLLLSLIARSAEVYEVMNICSVPFYVAAPTTTLDPSLASGDLIKIEERDPRELTHHLGHQVAAPGINVRLPDCRDGTVTKFCNLNMRPFLSAQIFG